MQTNFTLAQLADSGVAESEKILRNCVHCGFCTATCPTYTLLGDELDSPRGRIYLIKDMLENDRPASAKVAKHIDRCLSCLSCMTTCPSGVHYMHLVDHARKHIEETYRRPLGERLLRSMLATTLPSPTLFRLSLIGAWFAKPFAALLPGRLKGLVKAAPTSIPARSSVDHPQIFPAEGTRRARVALLSGCAQPVLDPQINEATIRLLTRHGVEVVVAKGAGCCGSLTLHMGREAQALVAARANVEAWMREIDGEGLDAIVINASGCGTTVKDYGFMLRDDPDWRAAAETIAGLAKDISEVMLDLGLQTPERQPKARVAYHAACSMQHGQKVVEQPKSLLKTAGFEVTAIGESHLCCGWAGTYNVMQPEISQKLKERKIGNIERSKPDIIAAGNLGCITHIGGGTDIPILHTVQLLDWATGGPLPKALEGHETLLH
ncbi:glycolate oxidase subunit GlcF [Denitrobaculum tricleocarpae]|uniref:Glycolate oxidase iron-sulfur subunit n=1 Tax=Denitrobaculum tricleocarpae TaxID=2591009 RepID=A0A545TWR5_9PROT|nr:glycolate oxidase subunit GlcF [Denitrobaculum tricleocarpae]TQV81659.1 glycolate oxidase subunit GlcF [Denitrobaculum tricleocarpae]